MSQETSFGLGRGFQVVTHSYSPWCIKKRVNHLFIKHRCQTSWDVPEVGALGASPRIVSYQKLPEETWRRRFMNREKQIMKGATFFKATSPGKV